MATKELFQKDPNLHSIRSSNAAPLEASIVMTQDEVHRAITADRKKEKGTEEKNQSYRAMVKRQFKKNILAVWALRAVYVLFFIAIFADFLANDKPLFCTYHGNTYFPVVQEYLVDLGITRWPKELLNVDWQELKYDAVLHAPIPYRASNQDLMSSLDPPGRKHYLGTDQIGRDVMAGLIHGSRISLSIGFVSMSIAISIGVLLGALAGYFRGWVDMVISRLVELFLNLPVFFLIITIVAFFKANVFLVMAVIGATGWMTIARLTRGEVLRLRNTEFVAAAEAVGFPDGKIILRHILPNALAPVLVSAAFGIAGAILTESALSFLGFGVPATIVTWGSVLSEARGSTYAWWLAVFPGLAIFLTVVSYNLVGEGLRDALDPRLKN